MATEGVVVVVVFAGLAREHNPADTINLYTGQYSEVEICIHRFILSEAPSMDIIAFLA